MAYTSKVTKTRQSGYTPSGRQVVSQKTQVSVTTSVTDVLRQLVLYFFAVVEILLLFRFILKLLGANPGSAFVSFIYSLSGIFEYPFRGIFFNEVQQGLVTKSVLEPSSIVAILVYAVIAFALEELIRIITRTWEE